MLKSNIKEKCCPSEHIQCLTLPDYRMKREMGTFIMCKYSCIAALNLLTIVLIVRHYSLINEVCWKIFS